MMAFCVCGHDLGQHPPDPVHQFAWPCRACDCTEYRELTQAQRGTTLSDASSPTDAKPPHKEPGMNHTILRDPVIP